MFSVYGTNGQVFRGSLEELRQVAPVAATARTAAVPEVAFRVDTTGLASSPAAHGPRHQEALHAYAQVQKPEPRHPLTRVDELMSREVVTLPLSMSIIEAWQTLASHGVGQAPVVNERNVLVGLLTRADLLQAERLPSPDTNSLVWRAFLQQGVGDIMLTPVPSAAPDADIRRVARVLLDARLPGLPVVDDGGVVQGFISRSDILRAVVMDPPLDLWG